MRARRTLSLGFTLLELLVVMVIIGLLAAYVGPQYFSQLGKSEVKAAQAQVSALQKALDTYRIDVGHYPTTEQGLGALVTKPQNEAKWSGPYLQKVVPPTHGAGLTATRRPANTATTTCFPSARTASPAAPERPQTSPAGDCAPCNTKSAR